MKMFKRVRDESRNGAAPVGESLYDAVLIPGYEDYSVWGFDEGMGSYWANLWRNDEDRDAAPSLSVGASGPLLRRPEAVMVAIAEHLGFAPVTVTQGLGLQTTRRRARSRDERLGYLASIQPGHGDYSVGVYEGAAWLAGQASRCPVSGWPCHPGFIPGAEHIHAEVLYASGAVYLGQNLPRHRGAEQSLMWAIGPGRS